MKKAINFLALCAVILACTPGAQTNVLQQAGLAGTEKKAVSPVTFFETKHNFGKVRLGDTVTYTFTFENAGNRPIVIEYARAACGCTTPTWPKDPVVTKGEISAGFYAAVPGWFDKSIFVKLAGYDQLVELSLTGEAVSAGDYKLYKETVSRERRKLLAFVN